MFITGRSHKHCLLLVSTFPQTFPNCSQFSKSTGKAQAMLRNPLNYSRPFSEAEGRVENQIIGWKMDQGYWEISSPTLFPVICRLAPNSSGCLRMSFDFPLAGKVENPARTCKMSVHCCNTCRMARKVKKEVPRSIFLSIIREAGTRIAHVVQPLTCRPSCRTYSVDPRQFCTSGTKAAARSR